VYDLEFKVFLYVLQRDLFFIDQRLIEMHKWYTNPCKSYIRATKLHLQCFAFSARSKTKLC